ncbi:arylesterase [Croceicoccus sp. F390]|uniref:Arylesterase n=1 Tax=Croceicoccus esteveae TaxID=3075597 RepID=A0ABU2ZE06_9SPHN|nr:arylesterase [Croceicoccus sp. F390]MDT0574835.1 arylesterase [Croceicoccus sp. F390]
MTRALTVMAATLMVLPMLNACSSAAPVQSDRNKSEAQASLPEVPQGAQVSILALGDSLFAGYNIARRDAYPEQLEAGLRARGINAAVVNAGVSGDTTAAGLQRLDFVLDGMDQAPQIAIIELGANDMLRGLSPQEAKDNLDTIMARFDSLGVPMILMGMRAAPNLGPQYAAAFDAIYPELADKYDAALVPLFVEPLLQDRSLVQADQLHPTADGVQAMVAHSIDTIAEAVRKAAAAPGG